MKRLISYVKAKACELNKSSRIIAVICIIFITGYLAIRHTLVEELYNSLVTPEIKNAMDIIVRDLKIVDIFPIIFVLVILVILFYPSKKMSLETAGITVDCYTSTNVGQIALSGQMFGRTSTPEELNQVNKVRINASLVAKNKQYLITKMKIRWKYIKGNLCSTCTCEAIQPNAKWSAILEIDVHDTTIKEKTVSLQPHLIIRPGEKYFGVGNFDIELILKLIGLQYHPCYNWDVIYSITLLDHKGKELDLIQNRSWRYSNYEEI